MTVPYFEITGLLSQLHKMYSLRVCNNLGSRLNYQTQILSGVEKERKDTRNEGYFTPDKDEKGIQTWPEGLNELVVSHHLHLEYYVLDLTVYQSSILLNVEDTFR